MLFAFYTIILECLTDHMKFLHFLDFLIAFKRSIHQHWLTSPFLNYLLFSFLISLLFGLHRLFSFFQCLLLLYFLSVCLLLHFLFQILVYLKSFQILFTLLLFSLTLLFYLSSSLITLLIELCCWVRRDRLLILPILHKNYLGIEVNVFLWNPPVIFRIASAF